MEALDDAVVAKRGAKAEERAKERARRLAVEAQRAQDLETQRAEEARVRAAQLDDEAAALQVRWLCLLVYLCPLCEHAEICDYVWSASDSA